MSGGAAQVAEDIRPTSPWARGTSQTYVTTRYQLGLCDQLTILFTPLGLAKSLYVAH